MFHVILSLCSPAKKKTTQKNPSCDRIVDPKPPRRDRKLYLITKQKSMLPLQVQTDRQTDGLMMIADGAFKKGLNVFLFFSVETD